MAKAAETAYEAIRAGILSGEFARGQRLREEELAARAGVSRTPIREALRRLDAEGLVEFTPNRGARVVAWSEQELEDNYEVRAMLESYGARLAAERITDDELDAIARIAARMTALSRKGAAAADELTVLNGDFHRAILRASRHTQLDGIVRGIMDTPLIFRTFQRYGGERMRTSVRQHAELVQALRARDGAWAEAVMRAHILAARSTIVQSLRDEEDGD
ncbi:MULTISPECIES: GntR family transcriptional regulator [Dactylosporangium]|uniref:GntR family transcriptional regulator n=2 Tax=Dactylosporangium TaxID=35753 RepID=A0A9W6NIW7_9ACTN|nr:MULTISPECIES: GntR family transcriptional regulator [Dactylosporangium]UAB98894.1 GntR family transcriptional regulator [Dactylosporangium vinaceum]UWZ47143.1 GntR family transcriptional regulator [Dactylosporangium matsuzakiense]GLK98422.1 GntR family transcriptional regulator [Dactylosporangium matsuzakiense]